ncbi:MAG: hypothetical protein ACREMQ_01540, partial [Longimicrobiales bacterium]
MWKAVAASWFSWTFRVLENDRQITQLERSWVGNTGSFALDRVEYRIRRDGLRSFALERDGHVLARTRSAFGRRFDVTAHDRMLTLKPRSLFTRTYIVLHGDREIGSMRATTFFRRAAEIDFPPQLLLPLRLFLAFLVITAWR